MLTQLIKKSFANKCGIILQARNRNNEILAMAFFVKSSNRIIYHTAICSEVRYKNNAPYLILDWIICRHAGQNWILDFEGSKKDGIARFFKGFGASYTPYFLIVNNNLLDHVNKTLQNFSHKLLSNLFNFRKQSEFKFTILIVNKN
jgi:hypothetical protein